MSQVVHAERLDAIQAILLAQRRAKEPQIRVEQIIFESPRQFFEFFFRSPVQRNRPQEFERR